MIRPTRIAAALAAALVLAPLPALAEGEGRFITVTGTGEVSVVPDTARVTLGVEAQGETADAALDAASEALAAVFAALDAAGIAPRDRQTVDLGLEPVYAERETEGATSYEVEGYRARSTLSIRVAELTEVGGLIDRLAGAGANRIDAIGFEISDPQAAMETARRRAVADARARATLYAEAAGVGLGEVVSISEAGGGIPPVYRMGVQAAEARFSVPVAEGSMTIDAQVTLVYRIADAP